MSECITGSREIVDRAIADFAPYAKVGLFSGGNDSLLLLELLKKLDIKLDFVIHVHTGTGLPPTLEFVREYCNKYNAPYIEASAGTAYEDYVLRKGFFGAGVDAHTYSYHVLKAINLRKAISKHIRMGKSNRNVLLFNGVRVAESDNRKYNFGSNVVTLDPAMKKNVWVNVIHWWTQTQRDKYLEGNSIKRSPVSIELGRSGECMCGTMQGSFDRYVAGKFCPAWGKWLDNLEKAVIEKGFPWKWGENINKGHLMERDGQLNMFQPMCVGCKALG
jgi:3'-phosphoadenosine 5'-phosphosulfate sulfotransferase (PAPS reductase)/FAD synthetase